MGTDAPVGVIDTTILILREWINLTELPAEMAISAVTLAESFADRGRLQS